MSEHALMKRIRGALAQAPGVLVWRNEVGKHWVIPRGSTCAACGADVRGGEGITGALRLPVGLGTGSADLIGLIDGRFFGCEVKTAVGRLSKEQVAWLDVVRSKGGIAGVARSEAEALALVGGAT